MTNKASFEFLETNRNLITPVFVYGSLKNGFGNHVIMAGALSAGAAVTVEAGFGMASFGAYPACYIPEDDEALNKIQGELYGVNEMLLNALDKLEGNGSFYTRELVSVECPKTGQVIDAWMYLLYGYHPPKSKTRVKFNKNLSALTWSKTR